MIGLGGLTSPTKVHKDRKRRLTSPQLEKLAVQSEPTRTRVKDRREEALVRNNEELLQLELRQQHEQRSFRFHTRWQHIRVLYALVSEYLASNTKNLGSSHNLPALPWVRKLAKKFHDAFPDSLVTVPQLEISFNAALQIDLSSSSCIEIVSRLRAVCHAFQHTESLKLDYREFLCAFYVLDRWREGEMKLLTLWFDEFSSVVDTSSTFKQILAIRHLRELKRLLFTACEGSADEMQLTPFFAELSTSSSSRTYVVTEALFLEYAETRPDLLLIIKTQCFKRLTDDMRLTFYQNIYSEAKTRFEQEETRFRIECAIKLWRSREPRQRMARWKSYVAERKLMKYSDMHFRRCSGKKFVRRLLANHQRLTELRAMAQTATVKYYRTLICWTFQPWKIFYQSMQLLHEAAYQRSTRHHHRVWEQRCWKSLVAYYQDAKIQYAKRKDRIAAIIASRHRKSTYWALPWCSLNKPLSDQGYVILKVLQASFTDWQYYYHHRKEVAAAELRERELHHDLYEQRLIEAEIAKMSIEDAISRAVQQREREEAELAQRRAFQDASSRVYANRKLRKQEEERAQYKRERAQALQQQMEKSWTTIGEKAAIEVRTATIVWLSTSEGRAAMQAEATRIFEQDLNELQKQLIQDPASLMLPGCRWQLRLEDYGRGLSKPYYINVETYEKIMCDDLIMDNCEDIAREILIQRQIDQANAKMQAKAAQLDHQQKEYNAAIKIQMLYRCRHALTITRNIIRSTFIKRIDPNSGDVVYFNIRRQETRRKPPKLIGSDENLIPVESSTWVRRVDDTGVTYYAHLETLETSWTAPPHYILCFQCKINFVTRRWNETGHRFCIVCYADGLRKRAFGEKPTFAKLVVQEATCVVCRNSRADVVCHECAGDATCWRCFQAVHRNAKPRGLWLIPKYYCKVGSASDVYTFMTAESTMDDNTFKIVVIDHFENKDNSVDTTKHVNTLGSIVDFIYHIDDISYADTSYLVVPYVAGFFYEEVCNKWMTSLSDVMSSVLYMVTVGHSIVAPRYPRVRAVVCHSFDHGPLHVTSVSSETDYDGFPSNECTLTHHNDNFDGQFTWLEADLQKPNVNRLDPMYQMQILAKKWKFYSSQ